MRTLKPFARAGRPKFLSALLLTILLPQTALPQIPSVPVIVERFNGLISFSPDGSKTALIGQDGNGRILDAHTNTLLCRFTLTGKTNFLPLWRGGGRRFGVFSQINAKQPGSVQWWDATTCEPLPTITGIRVPLRTLKLNGDESRLLTIADKGIAQSFDVETGRLLMTVKATGSLLDSFMGELKVKWSADGRRVLTFRTEDISIKLWDGGTGRLVAELREHRPFSIEAVFTADGRYVLTSVSQITRNEPVRVWNAEAGTLEREEPLQPRTAEALFGRVTGAISDEGILSPDGETILKMKGGKYELLEAGSLRRKAQVPLNGCSSFNFFTEAACLPPLFHPQGQMLMIQYVTYVTLWDAGTGAQIARLPDARGPAEFSPSGKWLVTRGKEKDTVLLWQISEGQGRPRTN